MRQKTQNTFANGMIKDLNPLSTPKDVLTDCLNGTIITYNGDEFVLQNDMGNCKVGSAKLSPGFIPLGMKEYAGIVYVASLNPETGMCEIGSFPSPQEDFSTIDFGNIGPANFKTSDFVVDTGDDSIKERTDKNLKLFEPELLQLHPGDLYVVTYKIHDPSPPADPSNAGKIDSNTKYDNYITQDANNRKLFKLVFSKISDNNNLVALPAGEIKVIPWEADVTDELIYYKEPSQAVLAVGLQLEEPDLFDASVVDASRNTDSDKKVGISAIGASDSLAYFAGVRVNVTSPVTDTFFLEKQGSNQKVGAILDGLAQNDSFQCTITPYSPYALYPKLTKSFNLTMGQYLSAGSGINNIFRYLTNPTFLKLDFDYRFQGNSPDGIHLYIEFYDPWSDYSVVKTVDNPTYYGLNSITIELVDEPRVDQFDSTTIGGTKPDKLITNSDTDYEKTLLNSTNKIRTDQFLRRNHFYIVRVSGVDKSFDASTQLFTYQHYDFYKGLYTTTMFNDVYTSQLALSINDPTYIADFNSLDFDLSTIGYSTTVTQAFSNAAVPVIQNYPNMEVTDPDTGITSTVYPLMTNQDYYAVLESAYADPLEYRAETTFETDVEYNVALDLQGDEMVFGTFKENLLSAAFPTLLPSDSGSSGAKPTIVEASIPSTPDTNSVADWVATDLGSGVFKVDLSLKTARSIEAPGIRDTTNTHGHIYELVDISQSFHYITSMSGAIDGPNVLGLGAFQTYGPNAGDAYLKWIDSTGTLHSYDLGKSLLPPGFHPLGPNGNHIYTQLATDTKKYSAIWGGAELRANFLHWQGAPSDYGSHVNVGPKNHMLYWRNEGDSTYCPSRITDIAIAIDFFNKVKVASNVTKDLYLYYPDNSDITYNGQLSTTAKFTGAAIITTFSPEEILGSPVKTYISTFRFKAINSLIDFAPASLNTYIDTRKSDSVILDGKQTIRDGFIPFITAVQTSSFTMQFDDINILQAANSATLTAIQAGASQGPQDPAFTIAGDVKPHGTVTLEDGNTQYTNYLGNFAAGNVTDSVVVDPSTVYLKIARTSGTWPGGWYENGSDHWGNAPYLYQDLQIS